MELQHETAQGPEQPSEPSEPSVDLILESNHIAGPPPLPPVHTRPNYVPLAPVNLSIELVAGLVSMTLCVEGNTQISNPSSTVMSRITVNCLGPATPPRRHQPTPEIPSPPMLRTPQCPTLPLPPILLTTRGLGASALQSSPRQGRKYYIVTIGQQTGVFSTWQVISTALKINLTNFRIEVQPLICGVPGALHQSFHTENEATGAYLQAKYNEMVEVIWLNPAVDGSRYGPMKEHAIQ
ncbi:hypothetical protein BYT27DRAFT_7217328 [Phlegmacium glaucopus]|nr:hypothetical protein BYT27DRAFT_7217328 [Phlegmacium glaucopus]